MLWSCNSLLSQVRWLSHSSVPVSQSLLADSCFAVVLLAAAPHNPPNWRLAPDFVNVKQVLWHWAVSLGFILFWDKVSLIYLNWSWTHSIIQQSRTSGSLASASHETRIMGCTTKTSSCFLFFYLFLKNIQLQTKPAGFIPRVVMNISILRDKIIPT